MIESYLSLLYQKHIGEPSAKIIGKALSPNQITFVSCLLGVLVLPALVWGQALIATILLLLSGYLDTLDGTVARLKGKSSPVGAVMDIVADRIVEFAVILGLFAIDPIKRGWIAMFMLGSCFICVTSFLVVGIFIPNQSQKSFHYNPGLIERAEAFCFFILMIWIPQLFLVLGIIFTILVFLTSFLRIKQFIRLA